MVDTYKANTSMMNDRDQLIVLACQSAANIMARHGLEPADVANGFISYGGALALETVGAAATAEVFQSKADGLRKNISN